MATLTQDKINQVWEKPKNKSAIDRADLDNKRQLFHAQLSVDRNDSNPYLYTYLEWIRGILNNDEKFNKFDSLLAFPLASNHLISKATDEWNKVFKAQDRVEEYNFTEEETEVDFQAFLEKINFRATIEQNLFTKVKQAVNAIAVVDVSLVTEGQELSEPYVYFIETGKLKDVDTDHAGAILYVMFERGKKGQPDYRVVFIDQEFYKTFRLGENSQALILETESAHGLGYCPASFLWGDVIDPDNPIRRYNSVLEIVDVMDEYLMWKTFADHVDLYSSFPIMWKYGNECDDEDGYVSEAGVPVTYDQFGRPIPKGKSDYIGPGWQIDLTLPTGEGANMGVPVGFVDPKPALLEYNREKIRRKEVQIIKHLTGVDNEIQNEKAFNESQIRSQYETRHSVLRYWAENMQAIHTFLVSTIARLRYREKFEGAVIDYGMDYFLYDTITADLDYKGAKEAGLPQAIVMLRREVVEQIETRNSPNKKARLDVLLELEPYADIDINKIDKGIPEYELKANFQLYINRFERENGDIVRFAKDLDYKEKISIVLKTLYEYVSENTEYQEDNRRQDPLREPGQSQNASISGSVA
jgi:hypothetical protein